MQLIISPSSPFGRKTRIVLREAGKTDVVEEVAVTTSALDTDPTVRAANPLGKIPALIRADGPALYDSRVITRYFDHIWSLGLYPEAHLFETLTLEATADGIMEASVLMVYESRLRPVEKQFEDWVEAQWLKVAKALDAIEERWMSHLGGPFDMAHIATFVALDYIDLRHDARDWRSTRPALAAWHAKVKDRPSFVETRPV